MKRLLFHIMDILVVRKLWADKDESRCTDAADLR